MSKTKKLLIVSVSMLAIGVVLTTAGYFMGGSTGIILDRNGIRSYANEEMIKVNENLDAFKNIEIDCSLNNIEIIPSDKYAIEMEYGSFDGEVQHFVKDDKLTISQSNFNKTQITVGFFNNRSYVKVYVPTDAQLDNINLNSNIGNLMMNGLKVDKVDLDFDYGNINLNNIITSKISIDGESGNIDFKNITAGEMTISNSYGNIKSDNIEIVNLSCNMDSGNFENKNSTVKNADIESKYGNIKLDNITSNGLTIRTDSGNINFNGELSGVTNVNSLYGNIDIRTSLEKSLYGYSANSKYGDVKIDNEKLESGVVERNDSISNTIDAVSDSGRIDIKFQ